MAVGPSQAPMTAMLTASSAGKPRANASIKVKKMPNWPAAPKSSIFGFSRRAPKSIMAPMPTKMSSGKTSLAIPMSYRIRSRPPGSIRSDRGMLTSRHPNPMGTSSSGSTSFFTPR